MVLAAAAVAQRSAPSLLPPGILGCYLGCHLGCHRGCHRGCHLHCHLYHHLPGILSFLCYDRHRQQNCLIPHFINHPHHLHQPYYHSNIFPLNLPDVVLLTFTSIKCVGVVVCCGTCQLKEEIWVYFYDEFDICQS